MNTRYKHLLSPLKVGNNVLKNRLLSSNSMPHFLQGPEPYPSEAVIKYMANIARNGAAIVTVSDWSNDTQRVIPAGEVCRFPMYDFKDPSLDNYMQKLSEAVHSYDSKIILAAIPRFPQGYGVVEIKGEDSGFPPFGEMPDGPGSPDDAPGGLPGFPPGFPGGGPAGKKTAFPGGDGSDPRWPTKTTDSSEMTLDGPVMSCRQLERPQMEQMIEELIQKLRRYRSCGFDGVSVHMAYGLGCALFLTSSTNTRTDEFGGSLENRTRLPMMIFRAIREEFGPDFFIECTFSGNDPEGGWTIEDSVGFAKIAEGVVDAFQIRECNGELSHPVGFNSTLVPSTLKVAEAIKKSGSGIITIPIGGFQDPDIIEEAIASGKTDMVGAARAFIADYDYGQKLLEGRGEDVVPCIRCNRCHGVHLDGPWLSACSVNPRMGLSDIFESLNHPPVRLKKVAVVGGGISGMVAAIECARRGHSVTLYEKSGYLGGQLFHAEHAAFKWPLKRFRDYLVGQIEKSDITVLMNTAASPEMISAGEYDAVIAALGAVPNRPAIPGIEKAVLASGVFGRDTELDENVVVIGGSEIGVEAGLYLAQAGHKVTLLSRQNILAYGALRVHYYDCFEQAWQAEPNFRYILSATATGIGSDCVTYRDAEGSEHTLPAGSVVIAGGMNALTDASLAFYGSAPEFYAAGDCTNPGNIQKCVRDAYCAAMRI